MCECWCLSRRPVANAPSLLKSWRMSGGVTAHASPECSREEKKTEKGQNFHTRANDTEEIITPFERTHTTSDKSPLSFHCHQTASWHLPLACHSWWTGFKLPIGTTENPWHYLSGGRQDSEEVIAGPIAKEKSSYISWTLVAGRLRDCSVILVNEAWRLAKLRAGSSCKTR